MLNSRESISWVIGGPQGSGVDSASHIFLKSIAMTGLHVFGKREYHSNIKGEHSYFSIRFSDNVVRSHKDEIDILVTFDAETVVRHSPFVIKEGILIYDPDITNKKIEEIHTLDQTSIDRIRKILKEKKKTFDFKGILEELRERGVELIELPYFHLIEEFSEKVKDHSLSKLARITNVMSLSASLAIINFDIELLKRGIHDTFANKPKILEINIEAATFTYEYIRQKFTDLRHKSGLNIKLQNTRDGHFIVAQGNQTSPLGKIVAGCRFQTYYPITPATDDSEYLESNQIIEQKDENYGSVVVIQTEDEISAITMAIGAALTGVRSCTTTSGPGFSLMAEALGWAGINEIPLMVTLYQRAGPSTGLPTRQEQGDLLFAINSGHGEFPKIVYASGDIEESFYDTIRVFNYAEIFQTPVIHLLDKYLSNSIITCSPFNYKNIKINRGKYKQELSIDENSKEPQFKRFELSDDKISLRVPLGTKEAIFWNTGDEHDEKGHITEDPTMRKNMMEKRLGKLEIVANTIPKDEQITIEYESTINPEADRLVTILSWGSTKGAILDSISQLSKYRKKTQLLYLQIKLLNPFPGVLLEKILSEKIEEIREKTQVKKASVSTVIIEMNYMSQLDVLIKQNTNLKSNYNILKYNGRPMSNTEIYDSLVNIIDNKSEQKVILTNGV